jgi:two-component system, OmpR family, sensor histidine kinase ChvG
MKKRLGLRSKLLIAAVTLVSVPLIVVWSAGLVDSWIRSGDAKELKQAAAILAQSKTEHFTLPQSTPALEAFAAKYQVQLRLFDNQGRILYRGPTKFAERFANRPSWVRSAGNFFFGPAGSPNLDDFDRGLPKEIFRSEIVAARKGNASGQWRFSPDGRLSAFYWAQAFGKDSKILYLTRISRRGVRALYDFRYQVLKLTLTLAFAVSLLTFWVGRNYIRPLLQLRRRVNEVVAQPGSFSPADLLLERNDEMGDLCRDFQKLAESLQSKLKSSTETAGDLAHDLKSPIATIRVSAELLQTSAKDDGNQRRLANAMLEASEHMHRSVDGLLLLAKLDQDLADGERQRVDISALVQSVVESYADDPQHARVTFHTSIEPNLASHATPLQLERLVRNILSNACDFCHTHIELKAERLGAEILIVISDDGPGVPPGNQPRLFERFFSVRPEGEPSSTGLGLAIAKTIAESHGGSVLLGESPSKKGATFEIRLPSV